MKTPQKIEPSIDNEISIADVINLFTSHKKMILILAIIGAILGSLFGKFSEPIYEGSVLYSPSKISGDSVVSPKTILTKLNMNSFYSKETFANCNPDFYKDKDKDKYYDVSNIVKGSIAKDFNLIQLHMQDKNKTVIKDCLNSVIDDIQTSENKIIDPFIQLKNNELRLAEEKLKKYEEFKSKLNDILIKELETNGNKFQVNLTAMNILLFINYGEIVTEINKINTDLLFEKTKAANTMPPINIKKKSFPSPKLGALLGLFLGLCLGTLLALIKK